MGAIISLLYPECAFDICFSPHMDLFVDFEKAEPTDEERDLYNECEEVLKKGKEILEELKCYKGISATSVTIISLTTDHIALCKQSFHPALQIQKN